MNHNLNYQPALLAGNGSGKCLLTSVNNFKKIISICHEIKMGQWKRFIEIPAHTRHQRGQRLSVCNVVVIWLLWGERARTAHPRHLLNCDISPKTQIRQWQKIRRDNEKREPKSVVIILLIWLLWGKRARTAHPTLLPTFRGASKTSAKLPSKPNNTNQERKWKQGNKNLW